MGVETEDYAPKHWSGLVRDYYAPRVEVYRDQALRDHPAPLNETALGFALAELSYDWTTAEDPPYPTEPTGDPVATSKRMYEAYGAYFGSCAR